jgi:hypothetical protein
MLTQADRQVDKKRRHTGREGGRWEDTSRRKWVRIIGNIVVIKYKTIFSLTIMFLLTLQKELRS